MRAIAFDSFGAQPYLTDVPRPEPGPSEVLVRLRASSVNGFDLAVINGMFKQMMPHTFPVVVGRDFAGHVEAIGDEVADLTVGDGVFGVLSKPIIHEGAFAEYAVAAPGALARIPDGLDHASAGVLGLAGTAARSTVDAVAPAAGETVLISGATGGVGAYAVQFASALGAHVIATARPGQESDFVRDLGATDVIDHTADLVEQIRAVAPEGVAAAIHLAGDWDHVAALVAPGGRIASTLGYGSDHAGGPDLIATAVVARPDAATLEQLATAATQSRLRVPISRVYPLSEAPRAFADFASGTVGKLAVAVS